VTDKHALVNTSLRETVVSHVQGARSSNIDVHDAVAVRVLSNTFARSWQRDNCIVHASTDSNILPMLVAMGMSDVVAHSIVSSSTFARPRQFDTFRSRVNVAQKHLRPSAPGCSCDFPPLQSCSHELMKPRYRTLFPMSFLSVNVLCDHRSYCSVSKLVDEDPSMHSARRLPIACVS
jgi:hypothetical protein